MREGDATINATIPAELVPTFTSDMVTLLPYKSSHSIAFGEHFRACPKTLRDGLSLEFGLTHLTPSPKA